MKPQFSPRSLGDLEEILDYVAKRNPQAALRLVSALENTCLSLPAMPGAGTKRDELCPGLRAFTHGNYVIYFLRPTERTLRIMRILHGARDVKPLHFDPPFPP